MFDNPTKYLKDRYNSNTRTANVKEKFSFEVFLQFFRFVLKSRIKWKKYLNLTRPEADSIKGSFKNNGTLCISWRVKEIESFLENL